jgi:hypothetical protein
MDQYGRFSQTPRMPAEYLPRRSQTSTPAPAAEPAPAPRQETAQRQEKRSKGTSKSVSRKNEDGNRNGRRPASDVDMYRAAS